MPSAAEIRAKLEADRARLVRALERVDQRIQEFEQRPTLAPQQRRQLAREWHITFLPYTDEAHSTHQRAPTVHHGDNYYTFSQPFSVDVNGRPNFDPRELLRRLVTTEHEPREFQLLDQFLRRDPTYRDWRLIPPGSSYTYGLEVLAINGEGLRGRRAQAAIAPPQPTRPWGPDTLLAKSRAPEVVMHRYLKYTKNPQHAQTFRELFQHEQNLLESLGIPPCDDACVEDEFLTKMTPRFLRRHKRPPTREDLRKVTQTTDGPKTERHIQMICDYYRTGYLKVDIIGSATKYKPTNFDPELGLFAFLKHNEHVYPIDLEIAQKFCQCNKDPEIDELELIRPDSHFHTADPNKDRQVRVADTLDDLVSIVDGIGGECSLTIYYNGMIRDLLALMLNEKVQVQPLMDGLSITGVLFHFQKGPSVKVVTQICPAQPGETHLRLEQAEAEQYNSAMNEAHALLFTPELKSHYHPDLQRALKELPMHLPKTVRLTKEKATHQLDGNRHYASAFRLANQAPVFGLQDSFDPVEDPRSKQFEPLSQYVVDLGAESTWHRAHTSLFDCHYARTYGFVLNDVWPDFPQLRALYRCRPSAIVDFDPNAILIAASKARTVKQQKAIPNILIGLTNKLSNATEKPLLFQDKNEAVHMAAMIHGRVQPLQIDSDEEWWYVKKAVRTRLEDGYKPIGDYVYAMAALTMYRLHKQLLAMGIEPVFEKTDAFGIRQLTPEEERQLPIGVEMGQFKYECLAELNSTKKKPMGIPEKPFVLRERPCPEFRRPTVQIIEPEDEEHYEIAATSPVGATGPLPGVGKSTLCQKGLEDPLLCCPTNELALSKRKEGFRARTVHKALNLDKHGHTKGHVSKEFKEAKSVIWEEFTLNPIHIQNSIMNAMRKYPDKVYRGNWDQDQLGGVEDGTLNNIHDLKAYRQAIVDRVFPVQVNLKQCKRAEDATEAQQLYAIKADLKSGMPARAVAEKYGFKIIESLSELKDTDCKTFRRATARRVARHVSQNLIPLPTGKFRPRVHEWDGMRFWVGQTVICVDPKEITKGHYLYSNYIYKITAISDSEVTIADPDHQPGEAPETFRLSREDFCQHMSLPYARTVHSSQGSTINHPITIFEADYFLSSFEWVWTAMTRVRRFKDITFCFEPQNYDTQKQRWIYQWLSKKIEGYQKQDTKARLPVEDLPKLTVDWFYTQLAAQHGVCANAGCCQPIEIGFEGGHVKSDLTADRRNNNRGHYQNNCRIMCLHCNVTRK